MSLFDTLVVVGPEGSGKAKFGEFLEKFGYCHVSTGDLIREEMQELGAARLEQGSYADEQRRQRGSDCYIVKAKKLAGERRLAVDGLRTPGEIQAAISVHQALIVWTDGPESKRHAATLGRGRAPTSRRQFRIEGKIEFNPGTTDPDVRNLSFVKQYAHALVWNPFEEEPYWQLASQFIRDLHNGYFLCAPHPKIYGDFPAHLLPQYHDPVL